MQTSSDIDKIRRVNTCSAARAAAPIIRATVLLGVSLTKLPGAANGGISPGQRATDAAHGTPDKAQHRKRSVL
ncbi:MAG: hypothetical protein JO115_06310 [Pseudonocardiales bacterium]|nr:hypothetical protein [Pseudonocardiales bacterium]